MDVQNEIHSLHGETLALTAIVGCLCARLAASGPSMAPIVAAAFDDAANLAEHTAIAAGKAADPEHTVKALRIIEELRAVALGKH
jgi:hypothetical protein